MNKLKIAIQKNGRLSEKSLELFKQCGIKFPNGEKKLKTEAENFPIELLFLRDDDIPQYVEQGVADLGILGENEVWEKNKDVLILEKLGFAKCRLSLAIPKDEPYESPDYFQNKKVATSYPKLLRTYFDKRNLDVEIEEIGGSVEIAPGIGLADGIFDIVSTGSTLLMNGLKEVQLVTESEAVLISNKNLNAAKKGLLEKLIFRIKAVKNSSQNKYILLNSPNASIPEITAILPGMKSPTILPLAQEGWSSLHSVVKEDDFWEIIDRLKKLRRRRNPGCPYRKNDPLNPIHMQPFIYPKREDWPELVLRPAKSAADIEPLLTKIFEDVRKTGDTAVRQYTKQFDKVNIDSLRITQKEIEKSSSTIPGPLKEAIQLAKRNIETFHASQLQTVEVIETSKGVSCWRENRPIEKIGIYIPGGSAPLFFNGAYAGYSRYAGRLQRNYSMHATR